MFRLLVIAIILVVIWKSSTALRESVEESRSAGASQADLDAAKRKILAEEIRAAAGVSVNEPER